MTPTCAPVSSRPEQAEHIPRPPSSPSLLWCSSTRGAIINRSVCSRPPSVPHELGEWHFPPCLGTQLNPGGNEAGMSKITKAAYSRNQLSYQEFAVKHESELADVDDIIGSPAGNPSKTLTLAQASTRLTRPPLPPWMQELKRTSLFRLLSAAGQENCPDALNFLLYFWLRRMGVRIPEGVFVEPRGTPGRPRRTVGVYNRWIEIGQPPLGQTKLAVAIFGEAFKQANAADRRRMIDRCRQAVRRHQFRSGQNTST